MIGSIAVEEVLLLLKIGFLVLLYLFIWRVVRTASRDLRNAPQESIILAPQRVQEQKKRSRRTGSEARTLGRNFSATGWPSFRSSAR